MLCQTFAGQDGRGLLLARAGPGLAAGAATGKRAKTPKKHSETVRIPNGCIKVPFVVFVYRN